MPITPQTIRRSADEAHGIRIDEQRAHNLAIEVDHLNRTIRDLAGERLDLFDDPATFLPVIEALRDRLP